MAKPKKWSEQILMKESLKVQENGSDGKKTRNVLKVCVGGLGVFKKHFINDKYKGMDKLAIPFDFVVVAGKPCPEGRFYELEYMLDEYGAVYRALIQAVNPCTDISLIIGTLQYRNILPKELRPMKAWLRDDIDEVHITHAWIDEEGVPCISWGTDRPNDDRVSLYDDAMNKDNYWGTFIEYYRGECREVCLDVCRKSIYPCPKVMVCGSDNVNDPAFAQQREADMRELKELLIEAQAIIRDYKLPHFIFVSEETAVEDKMKGNVSCNLTYKAMTAMIDAIYKDNKE